MKNINNHENLVAYRQTTSFNSGKQKTEKEKEKSGK
jgi:hypothetical protein